MTRIAGCTLKNLLTLGSTGPLYEGVMERNEQEVLIRLPRAQGLSRLQQFRLLEKEYDLSLEMGSELCLQPLLFSRTSSQPVIIFRKPEGARLLTQLSVPLSLTDFFALSPKLLTALYSLQKWQIIHRCLHPGAILMSDRSNICLLTDLGNACDTTAAPHLGLTPLLPDILPFLAPELTGYIEPDSSFATDTYSLGALFFWLLTGKKPFEHTDPKQQIHWIIAQPFPSLKESNPSVPECLDLLVRKMTQKEPKTRVSSLVEIQGLLASCSLAAKEGPAMSLTIKQDHPLSLAQNLVGREFALERLQSDFEWTVETKLPTIVAIVGESGIGKSTLLNELAKQAAQRGLVFLSVKAEESVHQTPYLLIESLFAQITKALLGQLLGETQEKQRRIQEEVGLNADILRKLAPDVGALLPLALAGGETKSLLVDEEYRVCQAVSGFLHCSFEDAPPAIVAIDNLQWIDASSIRLLASIIESVHDLPILFVVTSRFVGREQKSIYAALEKQILEKRIHFHRMLLKPLSQQSTAQMVADMLRRPISDVRALSNHIYEKTKGNPLFITQFLKMLQQEGFFTFDGLRSCWTWNNTQIRERIRENSLSAFLIKRRASVSTDAQRILDLLACFGNEIDAHDLKTLTKLPEATLAKTIGELDKGGFIQTSGPLIRIIHDRLRESIYASLSHEKKSAIHLALSRAIAHNDILQQERDTLIVQIHHFLQARSLIHDAQERLTVAEKCLEAGRQTRAKAGYLRAVEFFSQGLQFIQETESHEAQEMRRALLVEKAECLFLLHRHDECAALAESLLATALSELPLARIMRLVIGIHTLRTEVETGLQYAYEALRRLNFDFSEEPTEEDYQRQQTEFEERIRKESFEDLRTMTLPWAEAVTVILMDMTQLFIHKSQRMLRYTVQKLALFAFEYGTSADTIQALLLEGVYLAMERKRDLVEKLTPFFDKLNLRELHGLALDYRTRMNCLLGLYNGHIRSMRQSLQYFYDGVDEAQYTGDIVWTSYVANNLVAALLFVGENLEVVSDEAERLTPLLKTAGFEAYLAIILGMRQMTRALVGKTRSLDSFTEVDFNPEQLEKNIKDLWKETICLPWYYTYKMQLLYHAGKIDEANVVREETEKTIDVLKLLSANEGEFYLYSALIQAEVLQQTEGDSEKCFPLQKNLTSTLERLERYAEWNPANFRARFLLAKGAATRCQNNPLEALRLLERANREAEKEGFKNLQTIIAEQLCKIAISCNLDSYAQCQAKSAERYCQAWGAKAKLAEIEHLQERVPNEAKESSFESNGALLERPDELQTLLHAVSALSKEIFTDKLIDSLVQTLMRYSGASRIRLIDEGAKGLQVVARADVETRKPLVKGITRHGEPTDYADFPISLVQYVLHTKRPFLVRNPRDLLPFRADPYFSFVLPPALFCFPLIREERLQAIVYLENSEIAGAFNQRRIEILDLIARQAAFSLENAKLYSRIKESEQKLKAIISHIADSVVVLNEQGDIVLTNEAFQKTAGIDALQKPFPLSLLGKMASSVYLKLDGSDYPMSEFPAVRALRGQTIEKEIVKVRKEGEENETFLQVSASPISRNGGEVTGSVSVARDVTDFVEADRLKDQFLRVVSHELKTPVTALKGYVQLLRKSRPHLSESDIRSLNAIEKSSNSLAALVSAMLDATSLRLGQLRVHPVAMDLNDLCKKTVADFAKEEATDRIMFEGNDGARVQGDPHRLRQVLSHLISNAIKFSLGRGKIVVRLQQEGKKIRVSVEDSGIGIPSSKQASVFNCFYRAHADTKYDFDGLGVGLYICREIIKFHGGEIGFQSIEEKGSTFFFLLPLANGNTSEGSEFG